MPSIETLKKEFGGFAKDDTLQDLNNKVQYVDTRMVDSIWSFFMTGGRAFVSGNVFNIDPSTPKEIVFINPSGNSFVVKVELLIVGRADGEVEIHFDPTIDTNGTALDVSNRLIGSPVTPSTTLEHGGSYSGYSSKCIKEAIVAGLPTKLVLALLPGHGLYIKISNTSGSANDFGFRIEWWEPVM